MTIPPWQSFDRFVPSAEQVLVGEVTEELWTNSADLTTRFRFRVDEALRGAATPEVVFDDWAFVQSVSYCATALSVHRGDRLVLAIERSTGSYPTRPVVGVPAFLNRDPVSGGRVEREFNRGLQQMSLQRVRDLVALPDTDAVARTEGVMSTADHRWAPLVALVVALGVGFRLIRRRLAR